MQKSHPESAKELMIVQGCYPMEMPMALKIDTPTVSAILAPLTPSGFGAPVVVSSARSRRTMAEIHSQVTKPMIAPNEQSCAHSGRLFARFAHLETAKSSKSYGARPQEQEPSTGCNGRD